MNTADLIWLNGEFVAWEDAKVHVLTHALHYGTGVFEGVRAYETPTAARRSSATTTTSTASSSRRSSTTWTCRTRRSELREATHELIARNGFKSCYIRPLVYRGYGPMGLDPLDNPVEAIDRGAGSGAPTSARRASRTASARTCLVVAADLAGLADPARQGVGPVPQLGAGQDRGRARPATRRRSCSTTTATSARAPARTSSSSRDGVISTPRPHHAILDGINRKSVIEIAARPRLRGRRARHRARRAVPGRRGLPHRHGRRARRRCARSTTTRSATARPDHPRDPGRSSRTPCTAATSATPSGSTSCRYPRRHELPLQSSTRITSAIAR